MIQNNLFKYPKKQNIFNKVHPSSIDEDINVENSIKIKQHYLAVSNQEMKERNIKGLRKALVNNIRHKWFGNVSAFLTFLYTLLVIAILAVENQIYGSNVATWIVDLLEIAIVFTFAVEALVWLLAFGFTLYYSYTLNAPENLLIVVVIVWGILDLISDRFRVLGAYRVIRVTLLYLRLYGAKVHFDARKTLFQNGDYRKSILQEVYDILAFLRDHVKDSKLVSDISFWIDMIKSKKIYKNSAQTVNLEEEEDSEEDWLHWARINSSNNVKKGSAELRKNIQKQVAGFKINKEFGLSKAAQKMLERCEEFEFDIFELERETNGNELIVCSTFLLMKHDLFTNLAIDLHTYLKFISNIQNGYNKIAYHNKLHGMDVGRLAYYYAITWDLYEKSKFEDVDLFALIVGGAVHDFDHLGWNNAFLIETQHNWAITYNDISVCENHHIAAVFEIVKKNKEWNIFENMSLEEFKSLRKKLTKSVIATDMALHFDYVNKFKDFLADENVDVTKEDNKVFLLWMTLHVSDLTNPSKRWVESHKWTWLVYEEFFVQGDKEKELGLPIGMLNDRATINLAKSQMGFIDFIVHPSFEVFVQYLPKVRKNIDQIKSNRDEWVTMVDEWQKLQDDGNDLVKRYKRLEKEDLDSQALLNMDNDTKKTLGSFKPMEAKYEESNLEEVKTLDRPNDNPTLPVRADSEEMDD